VGKRKGGRGRGREGRERHYPTAIMTLIL
jgi:hypothetical protein